MDEINISKSKAMVAKAEVYGSGATGAQDAMDYTNYVQRRQEEAAHQPRSRNPLEIEGLDLNSPLNGNNWCHRCRLYSVPKDRGVR